MNEEKIVLGIVDYIIFAMMLLISAGIGIYFRFAGGKQKTTEEYLLAGKDMAILPVAFSLMASFLSAITVIGIPAEMYKFGLHMAYINIGFTFGTILSSYVYLPVFFDMQASTAYEYLEKRFGKTARTLCSLAFVAQMILYMSVVLYAPALALSAVTNLSTWISVISIGVVCTFYCTLGGMKAVLWTDVFQAVLMYVGLLAVLIKGLIDVGGAGNVFRIANEGGRLVVPSFTFDLEERYTMWNVILQGVILSMSAFGGNQVQIQRLLTVKNLTRSRTALYVSIPMGLGFHLLNCFAGIVIYANFAYCDPMSSPSKPISSADQLLPYYVMTSMSQYPGVPGLCICGIFSASLSTVSSAVNSLSAVTMQDLVRPCLSSTTMEQKKTAFAAKTITLFYGALCVSLTFLVATFGNLIQASLTVFGMLGGPVLAIFFLGMMTHRANEKGAILGLITAIALTAWISFGSSSQRIPPKTLPVSLEGCSNATISAPFLNDTTDLTTTILTYINETETVTEILEAPTILSTPRRDIFPLYRWSYMWFAPLGFVIAVVIGYITSVIINIISGETKDVPFELFSPSVRWMMKDSSETGKKDIKEAPCELQITNGMTKSYDEKTKEIMRL